MVEHKKVIIIDDDGFLGKYVERELRKNPLSEKQSIVLLKSDEFVADSLCTACVLVSGNLSESPRESRLISFVDTDQDVYTRFRLPNVVGTGMEGELMAMARLIKRGTYYHVAESDARMTVVHAVDVARAARLAIVGDYKGEYLLTDGLNPLRREVADGISNRLGQKHIPVFSLKLYRKLAWWGDRLGMLPFTTERLRKLTTDDVVQGVSFATVEPAWQPVDTVNYLNTHDYGNDDF